METKSEQRPALDVTVRVGCSLAYEVTGTAWLLLNVRPRQDRNHQVIFEALALGNDLPAEPFTDSHGNAFLRVQLAPGSNYFRHDAIVGVSSRPDNHDLPYATPQTPGELPVSVLRYTLPSRYCDSDKLANFAWEKFGHVEHGLPRVNAISAWLHNNIEYRYMSGRADLSAWDVLQRGYGVCRDFAHLVIALNRTFNLPARYVTGHLPDIGFPDPENHMDFHAYAEVYVAGHWYTTDARFHVPRIGRIKVSCGQDAVDGAFSTIYGAATLAHFEVWAYQVARGTVGVGDPVDLSRRLDNRWDIHTEAPYSIEAS
jgi:transglutaminase-like putative cysteine protease